MQEMTVVVSSIIQDLPMAKLQIVLNPQQYGYGVWLRRPDLEPELACNADGLWVLSLYRQGQHMSFVIPYIESQVILAEAELGFVVVLVAYHGTKQYSNGYGNKQVSKGQFYRYYIQQASGNWEQVDWKDLNDNLRQKAIDAIGESGIGWAKSPGKLASMRGIYPEPDAGTGYKVVRKVGERFFSLWEPTHEWIVGERQHQTVKPREEAGLYSHKTREQGEQMLHSLERSFSYRDSRCPTSEIALFAVEIGGRMIDYGHKQASEYLCLKECLDVRSVDG